jgi:hypothetical protein
MLTEAAANGIDLNEVFGEGSNFEMGAIGKLIDEKLKPFTTQADIQRQQQQIQEDAALGRQQSFSLSIQMQKCTSQCLHH